MGIPIDILIFREECGKIKISMESFQTFLYTFLFSCIPCHKCLWKVSIGIPVDILIFRKECGKIKMSVESFHRHFHRHLYFPTFLATNVYGNFP
jgi:hypothetical protein